MAVETLQPIAPKRTSLVAKGRAAWLNNLGDRVFYGGTLAFASTVFFLSVLIGVMLWRAASPSIVHFGWGFLSSSTWDPITDTYGAWPYIYGTLVSSLLALVLAVPISLGTALFLAELAPKWMRTPISFLVELLAAVPSVVYGLWGVLVMVPWLAGFEDFLQQHFPNVPFFQGAPTGRGMMAGALILTVMILPFITSVSREVIKAVPRSQREAAFGLGATRWEAVSGPVLRAARSGIMGAIILGLARALGETMAVTMVIGNANKASISLFAPGNTLASILANNFAEADTELFRAALLHIALILFGVTIIVNIIAQALIWNMSRGQGRVTE